jgi:hypothetical protein
MQPFGCMRASKDGGCSSLLDPMWRSSRPSPFEARRPKRPGEHLRVTAKANRPGGNNLLVNLIGKRSKVLAQSHTRAGGVTRV